MPEGDTVYRQCARLHEALAGGTLTRCELRVASLATNDLVGWVVREVVPRGKHILIRLDPPPDLAAAGQVPLTLRSHLMMDGVWSTDGKALRASDAYSGPREAHTIRIALEAEHPDGRIAQANAFDVKLVRLVREREEAELIGHLGPDLLDPGWDDDLRDEAVRRLRERPERPLGLALLDQRNLAGIGNIYRCELCFLERLHPARPVRDVQDLAALVDRAHRLLVVNRERTVRQTTGGMMGRRDGDLWVYARGGKQCWRCRSRIERGELDEPEQDGAEPRVIYFCPRCQEPPTDGAPALRQFGSPGGRRPPTRRW